MANKRFKRKRLITNKTREKNGRVIGIGVVFMPNNWEK